jgi:hypothetical protein
MFKSATALMLAAAIAGCTSSSGVFAVGPDNYRITSTAITSFGGAGTASASAIRTATRYCADKGKSLLVVDTAMDSQFTQGSSDVTFKCVDPAP